MLPWNLLTAFSMSSFEICSNGAVVNIAPSASCVVVDAPSNPIVSYSCTESDDCGRRTPASSHLGALDEACQVFGASVDTHHSSVRSECSKT